MMMFVGLILLLLGGGCAVLIIMQMTPVFLVGTPVTLGSCVAVAVIGLVIMIFNKRPGN